MSDEAVIPMGPDLGASRPGRGGKLATIGGVGAVTLLAAGAGIGIAFLIANPAPLPAEETAEAPLVNPAAYAGIAGPLTLVRLDPVVTNIATPSSAIARLEASLVIRSDAGADAETLAAQVSADTLAFARTLDLAQIEGARGLLHLREDLKERAVLRSPAIADYIIHSLVAQ